jgi:hypothetical protein
MTENDEIISRRVQWRRIRTLAPHCPECGQQLLGNNSLVNPYRCSCGIWQSDWENPGFYRATNKEL